MYHPRQRLHSLNTTWQIHICLFWKHQSIVCLSKYIICFFLHFCAFFIATEKHSILTLQLYIYRLSGTLSIKYKNKIFEQFRIFKLFKQKPKPTLVSFHTDRNCPLWLWMCVNFLFYFFVGELVLLIKYKYNEHNTFECVSTFCFMWRVSRCCHWNCTIRWLLSINLSTTYTFLSFRPNLHPNS